MEEVVEAGDGAAVGGCLGDEGTESEEKGRGCGSWEVWAAACFAEGLDLREFGCCLRAWLNGLGRRRLLGGCWISVFAWVWKEPAFNVHVPAYC